MALQPNPPLFRIVNLKKAGPVIDRDTYDVWVSHGKKNAWDRACEEVERVLSSNTIDPLPDDSLEALTSIMKDDARRMGIDLYLFPRHPFAVRAQIFMDFFL